MPMSDNTASLILECMPKFENSFDAMRHDNRFLREAQNHLSHRITNVAEQMVRVNRRLDRLDGRVERIERRLDLVEV